MIHHDFIDEILTQLGIFTTKNQSSWRCSTVGGNDGKAGRPRHRRATVILSACITRAARTMTPKETTKESQHAGILAITRSRSLSTEFYVCELANAIFALA